MATRGMYILTFTSTFEIEGGSPEVYADKIHLYKHHDNYPEAAVPMLIGYLEADMSWTDGYGRKHSPELLQGVMKQMLTDTSNVFEVSAGGRHYDTEWQYEITAEGFRNDLPAVITVSNRRWTQEEDWTVVFEGNVQEFKDWATLHGYTDKQAA